MNPFKINGQLIAIGGGDNIPLLRPSLILGRRESCDICLRFPNVSGKHCEFIFQDGYWKVRDLGSTNGVKVNGERVSEKLLRHQDLIAIGKRMFQIHYDMPINSRQVMREQEDDAIETVMGKSLLEKAGLVRPVDSRRGGRRNAPLEDDVYDVE